MVKLFKHTNAKAVIRGGRQAPHLRGEVTFEQKRNGVLVTAQISGLPHNSKSGFFAMHIHEGKSCAGPNFAETGSHYNPQAKPHPKHAGDMPPLLYCAGSAYLSFITDRFRVQDIIGRTVVIHNGADDFKTQPAGNSGDKIACGIIRKAR